MRRYTIKVREREFSIDVQELSADRFEVMVGDESYDVTLSGDEDLPDAVITPGYSREGEGAGSARQSAAATTNAMPVRSAAATAPAAVKPKPDGSSGAAVNAPMPGMILELFVKVGDVVERGQQIAVLDAMKMHNFIGAPRAGTITEVCIAPGQAVGHGEAIVRYRQG